MKKIILIVFIVFGFVVNANAHNYKTYEEVANAYFEAMVNRDEKKMSELFEPKINPYTKEKMNVLSASKIVHALRRDNPVMRLEFVSLDTMPKGSKKAVYRYYRKLPDGRELQDLFSISNYSGKWYLANR